MGKKKRKKQKKQEIPHRHLLYSASVQSPDTDPRFLRASLQTNPRRAFPQFS